jgi:DUF971 family protein
MSISIYPTEIKLHKHSRLLEVTFEDGACFKLSCEYLRVFSPSAETRGHWTGHQKLVTGKEVVNITDINPVGNYAVRLIFDDGHSTGIYSWNTLYDLGINQDYNWKDYLHRLAGVGKGCCT